MTLSNSTPGLRSIRGMMSLTAFAGVAIAAMVVPGQDTWRLLFASTLMALVAGVLYCLITGGRARARWIGFSLFGRAYFSPYLYYGSPHNPIYYDMPTRWIIQETGAHVFSKDRYRKEVTGIAYAADQAEAKELWEDMVECFHASGHAIAALMLGLGGSVLAKRAYDRDRQEESLSHAASEVHPGNPRPLGQPQPVVRAYPLPGRGRDDPAAPTEA